MGKHQCNAFAQRNPEPTVERLRVLILGYGEMGHAMEALLAPRHDLAVWQRRVPIPLDSAVPNCDAILFCLPATAHDSVAKLIAPHLQTRDTLIITIAKGLDDQARLPAEVLAATVDPTLVAVLYGPMIAEEIRASRPAYAECAAPDDRRHSIVDRLFQNSQLHIEHATDLTGLSWSAILKNIYAIAFGMADELKLGDNVRGLLAVTALNEISRLVHLLGGAADTPYRLAGLGDLITTATSSGSHHHELGRRVVRGEQNLQGEGVHTLAMLRARPRFDSQPYRLFRLVDESLAAPGRARGLLENWVRAPFLVI
jgi:glycerol-3-phosphate dehydrogenase (NAD(P)+)